MLVQKSGQVDVINAVWDFLVGDKPREVIHYSSRWSDAPEPADCAFPARCIRHGLPVVREHWLWQGADVGQYRKMLYDYEDPRVDLQGRGFLGFGKVHVRDADRRSKTTTSFDNATRSGTIYPYAGLPKVVMHVAPILHEPPPSLPAVVRARITRTETFYHLKHTAFSAHFVHPFAWTSNEWEQDVLLKTDGVDVPHYPPAFYERRRSGNFEYDDYGNRTNSEEVTQGGVRRILHTPCLGVLLRKLRERSMGSGRARRSLTIGLDARRA